MSAPVGLHTEEEEDHDGEFRRRIESIVTLVQAWESDTELLRQCRASIPWEELRRGDESDIESPYAHPDDRFLRDPSIRFLQRFCRYFKNSMQWVNQPPCPTCSSTDTKYTHTRQGIEESEPHRVEVYQCSSCGQTDIIFPRYNNCAKLFQTRKGRCGEYANLFGCYCRALGLTTRYVLDFTDHVWIEVQIHDDYHPTTNSSLTSSSSSYIMIDPCEGVIDENSMYEVGWGKQLSYIIAVGFNHVMDVTARYTRQFHTMEMQTRRRRHTTSEIIGQRILRDINTQLLATLASSTSSQGIKQRQQIQQGCTSEEATLLLLQQHTQWNTVYGKGRISGNWKWKLARGETGQTVSTAVVSSKKDTDSSNTTEPSSSSPPPPEFHVESFYPQSNSKVTITLDPSPSTDRHRSIVVNDTACAMGEPNTLSVVVLDEANLGCILQSRCVRSQQALQSFVDTIPDGRIVAIHGDGPLSGSDTPTSIQSISRLAQFDWNSTNTDGIFVYFGQVGTTPPNWIVCQSYKKGEDGSAPLYLAADKSSRKHSQRLRTYKCTRPSRVIGRLTETIMPLQTQLLANHTQKRIAFLEFVRQNGDSCYAGYTTKSGAPIYLLGPNAYPFEQVEEEEDGWATFLMLPSPLVPEDDHGIPDHTPETKVPSLQYEVPVAIQSFIGSIGPQLLQKVNGVPTLVNTDAALRNTRLVGLYFSAHWCGPCRQFTPMLAEFYDHLKEAFPSHGLEIVFVSSDRDENSFQSYYRTMPWLAIPFANVRMFKEMLSLKYGVRGIPFFVILDSVTGEITVDSRASRQEVMQSCQRGEDAIVQLLESWLLRVPSESREILDLLELSCNDTTNPSSSLETPSSSDAVAYLTRPPAATSTELGTAERIKAKFTDFVSQGMSPNEAAAKAIVLVSSGEDTLVSPLDGLFKPGELAVPPSVEEYVTTMTNQLGKDSVQVVLSTAMKYIENIQREPWNPQLRRFKLSNKVADRMVRVPQGLELLSRLGFDVRGAWEDFYVFIPVYIDIDSLHDMVSGLLQRM